MKIRDIKRSAAQEATQLLEHLGIEEIPVDVEAVAERLGVKVVEEDLDDDVSGVLVTKSKQSVIGVNRYHHRNRQRFTIAHELGHFRLHGTESPVFVDSTLTFRREYRRDKNSSEGVYAQEIAANAFAAELLMPRSLVRRYLRDHNVDLYDEVFIRHLASEFEVSEQAMVIRLINLGLMTDVIDVDR